jgi:ribonuclease Y
MKNAEKQAEKIIERAEKQSIMIIKQVEKKQEELSKKEEQLNKKNQIIENLIQEQNNKLHQIANLSVEEAKQIVFQNIEKDFSSDLSCIIDKIKSLYQEKAKKEASEILAKTLYRVSIENSNNFLVETIQLPSEDFK